MTTSVTWHCETCNEDFGRNKFRQHLIDAHQINPNRGGDPCSREMVAHLDARDQSLTTNKWVIKGLVFLEHISAQRAADDPMRSA